MIIDIISIMPFGAAALMLAYIGLRKDKLSRFKPVEKLGIYEKDLQGLESVIVVANTIERPEGNLMEAVEDNFREGVKYLFLISQSNAEDELRRYYLIFKALAEKALAENNSGLRLISELVEIRKLPYDWPDVPHIFYQYRVNGSEEILTSAFRGNQKREGIADYYERLSESQSTALILALMREAPSSFGPKMKVVGGTASGFEPSAEVSNAGAA